MIHVKSAILETFVDKLLQHYIRTHLRQFGVSACTHNIDVTEQNGEIFVDARIVASIPSGNLVPLISSVFNNKKNTGTLMERRDLNDI